MCAYFEICRLELLLDESIPPIDPPYDNVHDAIRIRNAECMPPSDNGIIRFRYDPLVSHGVSRAAMHQVHHGLWNGNIGVYRRRMAHPRGDLDHYFGRIWILSGSRRERFVLYQEDDTTSFVVMRHYPADAHGEYSAFLSLVDGRWCHIKVMQL